MAAFFTLLLGISVAIVSHVMFGSDSTKLAGTIVIALMSAVVLVSFIISHFVVSRINAIAQTARDIMDTGDLSQRIQIDTKWDDLSNLAQLLNRFLERNESLMDGIREVSNNIAHDLRTPLTQIYIAKVMHKRLFPKINQFTYGVYYLALPLPAKPLPLKILSFHEKDHGARDGSDIQAWAREILARYGLDDKISHITLITMPRVLGYVFNPVSFFLCFDDERKLRAVICEVHNTFGEQHSYLCARADHAPILPDEWLEADKIFHVSPFLPREGSYKFRFAPAGNQLGIWIDYYDKYNNKQLLTSLTGKLTPLNVASLRRAFWSHPLVTLKVITLIHWQAAKLAGKGIRYIVKPPQREETVSATFDLTKK